MVIRYVAHMRSGALLTKKSLDSQIGLCVRSLYMLHDTITLANIESVVDRLELLSDSRCGTGCQDAMQMYT
jgi:hypothetical protein